MSLLIGQADGGGGPDFDLADEILAVIPTDPYDQLDLARKITSMAIASPVSTLEAEAGRMRQKLYEKDRTIGELQERVSHAQRARQEAESRLKISLDENTKLVAERDSLSTTIKKLSRDLAKLETFRRQLMQSLNDDTSSQAETDDIGTCDQSIPRAYPDKDEGTNGYTTQISLTGATDISSTIDKAPSQTAQRFSITPYVTPRLTPTGTPTSVSPRVYSAIGSPRKSSSMASPSKSHYDGRTTLSSWYTTSQHSSAGNSPRSHSMQERASRIDGREFFRQARTRLSYEQFSAFLANIKELNAQKQTREETLRKAEELFGMDNKDLYLSFQGLLNCSSH